MKRIRYISALVASLTVAGLGVGIASAGSTVDPSDHLVKVTKVVEGAEGDKSFVVDVCGQALNFNENGGTQTVNVGDWFDGPQTCIVSEPDDGGADDVEGVPFTCEFTGKDLSEEAAPLTEDTKVYPDETCEVVIENSFDPEPTTTTTAPPVVGDSPLIVVPAPVVVTPQFTG